jgi:type I restriction enzyme M protein
MEAQTVTTQEIVSKLWNLCNVLRDDGITYHQYVTELTYILFLKMANSLRLELRLQLMAKQDLQVWQYLLHRQ